jgi:catechol 2,3-dioxygenase
MNREQPLPATVKIGHVHLRVSDLGRATAFYRDVLGFKLVADSSRVGVNATFRAAGDYHHIALNTFESEDDTPGLAGHTGLHHFAILYPDRAALSQAVWRLFVRDYPIDGGRDHGATVSVYLRDPDGNGIELTYDRPRQPWFDEREDFALKNDRFPIHDLLDEEGAAMLDRQRAAGAVN